MASRLHYIPVGVVLLFLVTLAITYGIAVYKGDAEADLPYISDTGTQPPESCIFGQLFDIITILLTLTMFIRYKQVGEFFKNAPPSSSSNSINFGSFLIGLLGTFGLSLVANFQETNVIYVHYAGALLCFSAGIVYMAIQSHLSYRMHPLMNSMVIAHVRLFLAIISAFLFIGCAACAAVARLQFHGNDPRKWYPEDGGWGFHVGSAMCEWSMAFILNLFILTFVSDFRKFSYSTGQVQFIEVIVQDVQVSDSQQLLDGSEHVNA